MLFVPQRRLTLNSHWYLQDRDGLTVRRSILSTLPVVFPCIYLSQCVHDSMLVQSALIKNRQ